MKHFLSNVIAKGQGSLKILSPRPPAPFETAAPPSKTPQPMAYDHRNEMTAGASSAPYDQALQSSAAPQKTAAQDTAAFNSISHSKQEARSHRADTFQSNPQKPEIVTSTPFSPESSSTRGLDATRLKTPAPNIADTPQPSSVTPAINGTAFSPSSVDTTSATADTSVPVRRTSAGPSLQTSRKPVLTTNQITTSPLASAPSRTHPPQHMSPARPVIHSSVPAFDPVPSVIGKNDVTTNANAELSPPNRLYPAATEEFTNTDMSDTATDIPAAPLLPPESLRPRSESSTTALRASTERETNPAVASPVIEIQIGSIEVLSDQTQQTAPRGPAVERGSSLDEFLDGPRQ